MKKTVFSVAVSSLLFVLLPALIVAASATAPDQSGIANTKKSNGLYEILVFNTDQWQKVGILEYSKFIREKEIDLGQYSSSKGLIRLRLVQRGGGAAHIDTIQLGDKLPLNISGSDDVHALKKVENRDFDVLNAFERTLDFTFAVNDKNKLLKLTARVEPKIISTTPFQFPTKNLFKQIDPNSQFYTYTITPPNSAPKRSSAEPFFREFCRTGSGHPHGFTSGWVSNDDQYLYTTIEFLPDNTMDGDRDYAQLHVKSDAGITSFKVSEILRKWGDPTFVYTDEVPYQHKLYHFKVPLKEIGLDRPQEGQNLLLAFSAYGTATPATWETVSAGSNHSLGVASDGSYSLWGWGYNGYGQAGLGDSVTNGNFPVLIGSDIEDWVQVSAGYNHSVALKPDGTLWAWGYNALGQLGIGSSGTQYYYEPVQVGADSDWLAVSAGANHTIALKENGTIWGWGYNQYFELGLGDNSRRYTPVQIGADTDWSQISAGGAYTVALKTNGNLWAWGNNQYGQLGDGSTATRTRPWLIDSSPNWRAVAAGNSHTAALKCDNPPDCNQYTLWTWGRNSRGQLGDPTITNSSSTPIQIGSNDWLTVATGSSHTLALKSDSSLWAWGFNGSGQVDGSIDDNSDGIPDDILSPVQIGSDTNWDAASGGDSHSLALKTDGTLWAWGSNRYGQLGDGTNLDRLTPFLILDVDEDNMADGWESAYGGDLDPGADPDGDLFDNLAEYRQGSNPNVFDPSVSGSVFLDGDPWGGDVYVHVYSDTCLYGQGDLNVEQLNQDGTYQLVVPSGDAYVRLCSDQYCESDLRIWWAQTVGQTDCNNADAVSVLPDQPTQNVDFCLEPVTIDGQILNSQGDPVAGAGVDAYSAQCYLSDSYITGTSSNVSGYYSLDITRACGSSGPYYVTTSYSDPTYATYWWTETGNTTDCSLAESIPRLNDINFGPPDPTTISGSVISGATGSPISGVTVSAYSEDTGQFFSDTTIGDGSYQLDNLTPGCFRIDVFANTDIGHVLPARRSVEIDTGDHAIEDFVLAAGGYTVEGTVNSTGAILEVFFDNDAAQVFAHTLTDPATGSFRFYNLPAGDAEIWVHPSAAIVFEERRVSVAGSPTVVNFPDAVTIDPATCVSGQFKDDNSLLSLQGIVLEIDFEQYHYETNTTISDATGTFTICNLPAGIAEIDVNLDSFNSYCRPPDRKIFVIPGIINQIKDIFLQTCSPVTGSINYIGPDPPCDLEAGISSQGLYYDTESDIGDNLSYQLRMPDGDHYIYFEVDGGSPYDYAAYPSRVTISNGSVQTGPEVMEIVYDGHPDAATVEGTINETSGTPLDPTDRLVVVLLPAGILEEVTPAAMANIRSIQEIVLNNFGYFSIYPVPPGLYDLAYLFMQESIVDLESGTIIGLQEIEVPSGPHTTPLTITAPTLDYNYSAGQQISGNVKDDGGNPILDALVLATDPNGDLAAFAYTDQNGDYTFYHMPPVGTFTVSASHPQYIANPATDNTEITLPGDPPLTAIDDLTLDDPGEIINSLSGTVFIEGLVPPTPLQGVQIDAYYGSACSGSGYLRSVQTDVDGNFDIPDLPAGDIFIRLCPSCTGQNYVDEWWNGVGGLGVIDCNQAVPITIGPGQTPPDMDFYVSAAGSISGSVLDQNTNLPVDDTSSGSITLTEGWHKFVYRQTEGEGFQASRAAFKAPGNIDWRWFSTSELDIRTAPNGAENGISLINKRNTCSNQWPVNHEQIIQCVDTEATSEAGWYGESTVNAVNHDENIHGNDDFYTSYYEGYFYVDSVNAGTWYFSTDSDDASELVIDDQVVAHWYGGHGPMDRWEHKFTVSLYRTDTRELVFNINGSDNGSFFLAGVPAGTYIIEATAPGYTAEYYMDSISWYGAQTVTVVADQETALQAILLGQGPSSEAFTLWMQKRARFLTYEDNFIQSTQKVHVDKDIYIERWNGSQAEMASPDMTWSPGEKVENVYVDIENTGILPTNSSNHNTDNPTYEWTDLPDYTTNIGWYEFYSFDSDTADIAIPADFRRSVSPEEIPAVGGTQVVTLEVTVHDDNVRRFIARVYFDDKEIVDADIQGGNGTTSYQQFSVDNPVPGQPYTFETTLTITPKNNNNHTVRYIPHTRLRLYYPFSLIPDNDVAINGSAITVTDDDIGTYTITPENTVYWDAVYKELNRIELEQLRIIEEVGAAYPTIISRTPADDIANVPVESSIEVRFSEPMNTERAEKEFTLYDENGNAVYNYQKGITGGNFAWTVGDTVMTYTPLNALKPGTGYEVFTWSVDKSGEIMRYLQQDNEWDFVTEPDPADITPPTVVSTWPFINATGVSTTGFKPASLFTHITAVFSEAMDPVTLNTNTVSFEKRPAATSVPFSLAYHLNRLEIIPDSPLEANTEYEIALSGGMNDANGNPLQAPYSWRFTTGEADTALPQVIGTIPSNGEGDVDVWYPYINVYFNEEIDLATVNETTVTLTDSGGNPLDFYPRYWQKGFGLQILRGTSRRYVALDCATTYTITIETGVDGVTDLAGNPLADQFGNPLTEPYTFSFTTVASRGNSTSRFNRLHKSDVIQTSDGPQFDLLLRSFDQDSNWPGEQINVTVTDGTTTWDLLQESEFGDIHTYRTESGDSEPIENEQQTLTYSVEDTAEHIVSKQKNVFVFDTVPTITAPTEGLSVPLPASVTWNSLTEARMYRVAIYDGPEIEADQKVWKTFIPDNGALTYSVPVPEDVGLVAGQTYFVEVLAWKSVAGNGPEGYARSDLTSFSIVAYIDSDGDSVPDEDDNCPDDPNPPSDWTDINGTPHTNEQANFDLDEYGDVCDPDDDNDGLTDIEELINGTNPNNPDSDGDDVNDDTDNCPLDSNFGQEDIDGDGIGDVCDDDPIHTGELFWDFESGQDEWSIDNGVWAVGTATAGPGSCYLGDNCAGTVLDGDYPSATDSRLISAPLELPTPGDSDELHLRFWQWFSYYNLDAHSVQISVWDAGSNSWQQWVDIAAPIDASAFTASGGWTRTDVDVTAYAGERVRFGFFHNSNNDGYIHHGWFIDELEVVTVPVIASSPPFSDDFEGGLADWSADNGVWALGTATAGPGSCYLGDNCAGTVLDGDYPSATDSRLISAPLELPTPGDSDELHLRFWQWFSYYNLDAHSVQISVWDAGSNSWQQWVDIAAPIDASAFTASGGWTRTDVDVTAYAGERVRFGFFHNSNNDGYIHHGWFIDELEVVTVPVIASSPPFSDDFEGGLADWSADNGVWALGTPTAGPGSCYLGDNCAGTVLDGDYPSATDSRLISAPLELPTPGDSDELHLRFWQWFSYYNLDVGAVQISVWDVGSSTWQPWTDIGDPVLSGSGGWTSKDVDVTAYAGERVRFGFFHNPNNDGFVNSGWFIDDIGVYTTADTDGDGDPDITDPDDDNDNVPDADDSDPLNALICRDADSDGCDDCTSGSDDPANDGTDTDGDGLCDLGDPDDDNDSVQDAEDNDPLDASICRDLDIDGCDDCSSGIDDPANDGTDSDIDGLCDLGDPDDDNDGVSDGDDNCPNMSNAGQTDFDDDGIGDVCDCDSGLPNPVLEFTGETYDYTDAFGDEYTAYVLEVTNRSVYPDELFAAAPHLPPCGSNTNAARTWLDIFDNDDNPLYGYCGLTDSAGLGSLSFNLPKGTPPPESVYIVLADRECNVSYTSNQATITIIDYDGDGIPDSSDPDDDNDNVADVDDTDPLNANICRDVDADGCDDCSSGIDDPANDGTDTDADGLCDLGDTDADGDGFDSLAAGGTDCNDLDSAINPDATEIIGDGIDQDCDGSDTVVIQPGYYFVDPQNGSDDPDHGGDGGSGAWRSLHYALELINAGAVGNYTLELAPGTYTFTSEDSDTPLVLNQDIIINGSGAELDGSGDHGTAPDPWTTGLIIDRGAGNVNINNLTITGFENGIRVTSDGGCITMTHVTMQSCETGLKFVDSRQLEVEMNGNTEGNTEISGCTTAGVAFVAASSKITLRNGDVENNSGDGIRIEDTNEAPESIRLENITVNNNGGNGIFVSDGSGHEIYECIITNNNTTETAHGGVAVVDSCATLRRNEIDGNHCHGVFAGDALSTEHLDATYNYWGDAGGPSGEGPGTEGDAVSAHVDFIPWFGSVPSNDTDGDGLADSADNCPANANADQADYDEDDIGDVCDTDFDGDGYHSMVFGGLDCDDGDATVHPSAAEIPNDSVDQDCDGSDTVSNLTPGTYFVDSANGNDDPAIGRSGDQAWGSLKFAIRMISYGTPGDYVLNLAPGSIYNLSSEILDIPLTVEQNLTINGSGAVLDGAGDPGSAKYPWKTGVIISPVAAKVTIQNLTIRNFEQGIMVNSTGGCLDLVDVTIETCDKGIQLAESYQVEVNLNNSLITTCNTGVEITAGSSNNTVRSGIVSGNIYDGLVVDASNVAPANNMVTEVEIINNGGNGIALRGGSGTEVTNCVLRDNNTANNGYGAIAVLSCCASIKWNWIEGIDDSSCSGIYADQASSLEIHGNLIRHNKDGIRLGYTSNVTIQNNTITENLDGLVIEEGSSPDIIGNIIWNNGLGTDLVVKGEYGRIEFNNVGTTDLPSMPAGNFSQNPRFRNAGADDYALDENSPCIDGTDIVAEGRDINEEYRPLGSTWDIGAYESQGYADQDGDDLPDWWEQQIVNANDGDNIDDIDDVEPDGDFDDDGNSNWDEWLNGTDPTTSISIAITQPAENLILTADETLTIEGTMESATSVEVKVNAGVPTPALIAGDTWSASAPINLQPGQNLITVTASGADSPATDSRTCIRDVQAPAITIIDPVVEGAYPVSAESISISGIASDDTGVTRVSWVRQVDGQADLPGEAVGKENWTTGEIRLVVDTIGNSTTSHRILITAEDEFSNSKTVEIFVLQEPNAEVIITVQPVADETQGSTQDDLDVDGDQYLNADESDCLPDEPLAHTNPNISPSNYDDRFYPTEPSDPNYEAAKVGYKWPDCKAPDDDNDGLKDECEIVFGSTTTGQGPGDDPDLDGLTNLQECINGTDLQQPPASDFQLTITDMTPEQSEYPRNPALGDYDQWLPGYGRVLRIVARSEGDGAPISAQVSLEGSTSIFGRAVNDPDPDFFENIQYPAGYDYRGPDFGLTITNPTENPNTFSYEQGPITLQGQVISQNPRIVEYEPVFLQCWDNGGRTMLVLTHPNDSNIKSEIWVPKGSGANGIASYWEYDNSPNQRLEPGADIDRIIFDETDQIYPAQVGDGFTNFEEYRGIVYIPPGETTIKTMRFNPTHKNLFVRPVGFDDAVGDPYRPFNPPVLNGEPQWSTYYPFRLFKAFMHSGIDIHNVLDWGHDATELAPDGTRRNTFFVYHRKGKITGINGKAVTGDEDTGWLPTWPLYEWEFKLANDAGDDANNPEENRWMPISFWSGNSQTLALSFDYQMGPMGLGDGSYAIRMPLPRINVLIVKLDRMLDGVYSNEDGNITFLSASPPDNSNLNGSRHWAWPTKGLGFSVAREGNHGLALVLKKPTDAYFDNRPYMKETAWTGTGWTSVDPAADEAGKLEPLSKVEDQTDQLMPIDGILPGDTANGNWDGDRRIADPGAWLAEGQSSPFDINGNKIVELPFASDPENVNPAYEYADPLRPETAYVKAWVTTHSGTHEIGHAIGVPVHTDVPKCLMYRYSSNWARGDYLSNWFRAKLMIDNRMRF